VKLEHCYGGFSIRLSRDDDLNAVIDLWQQLPSLDWDLEDSPESLQTLLLAGRLRLYVAACESVVAGAILVGNDGARGYLHHLAVAESKRGLGLGRALVDVALDELASRGIPRARVLVQIDNDEVRSFWAHCGWHHRTDLAVYHRDGMETRDAG
jgi:ribosomal protein S18 acetylase RimI-like enzyme